MSSYTATARREGRWWIVQCDQHPGALSQVQRLSQAAEVHREAISFVTELPQDEIDVVVTPVLDTEISTVLQESEHLRRQAVETEQRATALRQDAARMLADEGLTVRDIGAILGVSYQRAHQLLARTNSGAGGSLAS